MFDNKDTLDPKDPNRDFKLLESFVSNVFEEQKKSKRWGIFFKSLTFIYIFFALFVFYPLFNSKGAPTQKKPHVAMVSIKGPIMPGEPAEAARINTALRQAFKQENSVGILLLINSPVGSPVQSGYVYDEINRLQGEYPDKKVYAVIEDVGASGAYYIAAAADFIYANRASLVGSIGVTASGFGFVDTLEKLGVERRHYTSGEHKAFLDPFSPIKEGEAKFWQDVLAKTHVQFIEAVSEGRGDRLQLTDEITSGLIWNGKQSLALGLIDGLGSASFVAREIFKEDNVVDYSVRESPLKQIMSDLGVSAGTGIMQSLIGTSSGAQGTLPSLL